MATHTSLRDRFISAD